VLLINCRSAGVVGGEGYSRYTQIRYVIDNVSRAALKEVARNRGKTRPRARLPLLCKIFSPRSAASIPNGAR